MTVAESITRIIVDLLDVESCDVTSSALLVGDLGADSLALVELVLMAEEEFEIDIPDEDTFELRTVKDCVDYIENRLGGA